MFDFSAIPSDPELLARARRVAVDFAEAQRNANTAGIVFLGGIVRGYFDRDADIDIAIFERNFAPKFEMTFHQIEGMEVQFFHLDLDTERQQPWDTSKRWAYSSAELYADPAGEVAALLAEKVPLSRQERDQFIIEGTALSNWYINELPDTWIVRGDLLNAHAMLGEGIDQFLKALYAANDQLTPAYKWRMYGVQRLPRLPSHLTERLTQVMTMHEPTESDLRRRQQAFKAMWSEFLPLAEELTGKKYAEFVV